MGAGAGGTVTGGAFVEREVALEPDSRGGEAQQSAGGADRGKGGLCSEAIDFLGPQ